jgi:hypothetical protein
MLSEEQMRAVVDFAMPKLHPVLTRWEIRLAPLIYNNAAASDNRYQRPVFLLMPKDKGMVARQVRRPRMLKTATFRCGY